MRIDHYENFPVASWLCPPALRPAVRAIYAYARTADDLADEGSDSSPSRLAALADYRSDLQRVLAGKSPSPRWVDIFQPLARAIAEFRLPGDLLQALLGAFEQDVVKQDYADRADLIDYCRRSANPVGRLMLHLFGISDAASRLRSDAICSALQLINFWQDLRIDSARGRIYLPRSDYRRHGVTRERLLAGVDDSNLRAAVAEACRWAGSLLHEGTPLVHAINGRAGWELRVVVQGGQRILEKIAALGYATMSVRPTIVWSDAPPLLWRAAHMRRQLGAPLARDAR